MSEILSFTGKEEKDALGALRVDIEKGGIIRRVPPNPFFSEKDFNQELDVFRFIKFSTERLGNHFLGKLLPQREVKDSFLWEFNGEQFLQKSIKSVATITNEEDRFVVINEEFFLLPREYKENTNILSALETFKIGYAEKDLSPEKKSAFQKKIDATIAAAKRMEMKENYLQSLNIALHLFLHNPKNFSLTPSQFNSLCTEIRVFYTRKMFSEMTGDEFYAWKEKYPAKNKEDRKQIAKRIQKSSGEYKRDDDFLEKNIRLDAIPDDLFRWNVKAKKEGNGNMQEVSLREFIQTNSLDGKTYGDYLNAIETRMGIPQNYLSAIAKKESQGDPLAVSPSYAFGLFQLLPVVSDHHKSDHPQFHGDVNPFNVYMAPFRAGEKLIELKNSKRVIEKTKEGKNIYAPQNRTWTEVIEDYNADKNKKDYGREVLSIAEELLKKS